MKNLPNSVLKTMNEKATKELVALQEDGDTEGAHWEADAVLTGLLNELGFTELVEEYDKIDKRFA